ncbi:hypothetical protein RIF29_02193 [Crotalaria pallida]|uniref:Uncharacterized protein n=1 Tax=Crotalaria pallida TaxID=3830 RepID=A0AAN9IY96_CROPI
MKGLFIITERDKPKRKLPKDALRRVATPCHATLFAYITLEANAKPVPTRPKSTSKLSRLAPLSETTAQPVRGCQIEKRNDASCMHRPGCHLERTRAIPPRSHLGTIGLLSFRAAAQPVKASPNHVLPCGTGRTDSLDASRTMLTTAYLANMRLDRQLKREK